MSELVWGIKNGDLDQVREIMEKKVCCVSQLSVIPLNIRVRCAEK